MTILRILTLILIILLGLALEPAHAVKYCNGYPYPIPACSDPLDPNAAPAASFSAGCTTECSTLFFQKPNLKRELLPLKQTTTTLQEMFDTTNLDAACKSSCDQQSFPECGDYNQDGVDDFAYCWINYTNPEGNNTKLNQCKSTCVEITPAPGCVPSSPTDTSCNGQIQDGSCTPGCVAFERKQCAERCTGKSQCEAVCDATYSGAERTQCRTDCGAIERCINKIGSAAGLSNHEVEECVATENCKTHCSAAHPDGGFGLFRCENSCNDVVVTESANNQSACETNCNLQVKEQQMNCSTYWHPRIGVNTRLSIGATCGPLEIKVWRRLELGVDWQSAPEKQGAWSRGLVGLTGGSILEQGFYAGIDGRNVCLYDGGFGPWWPLNPYMSNAGAVTGGAAGAMVGQIFTNPLTAIFAITNSLVALIGNAINDRKEWTDAKDHEMSCFPIPLAYGPPPCCRTLATIVEMPEVVSLDISNMANINPPVDSTEGYSTFEKPRIRLIFPSTVGTATPVYTDLSWDYTQDLPGPQFVGLGQQECKNVSDPSGRSRKFCTRLDEEHKNICAYEEPSGHLFGCVERNLNMYAAQGEGPKVEHAPDTTNKLIKVIFTFAGDQRTMEYSSNANKRCMRVYGRKFCLQKVYYHPNHPGDQLIGISGFHESRNNLLQPYQVKTSDNNPDGLALLIPAPPCPAVTLYNPSHGNTTWLETELYGANTVTAEAPCQPGFPEADGCQRCPVGYGLITPGTTPTRECVRENYLTSIWKPVTNGCKQLVCPAELSFTPNITALHMGVQMPSNYEPAVDTHWSTTPASNDAFVPRKAEGAEEGGKPVCRHIDYQIAQSPPARECNYRGEWEAVTLTNIDDHCILKNCNAIDAINGNDASQGFAEWPTANVRTTANGTCVPGYTTIDDLPPTRNCISNQGNEEWDTTINNACIKECAEEDLGDGIIWPTTKEGQTATMTCPTAPSVSIDRKCTASGWEAYTTQCPIGCKPDKGWPFIPPNHEFIWPGCVDYKRACLVNSQGRPEWTPVQYDCSVPRIQLKDVYGTVRNDGGPASGLSHNIFGDDQTRGVVNIRGMWSGFDKHKWKGTWYGQFGPGTYAAGTYHRLSLPNGSPDPRVNGSCFSTGPHTSMCDGWCVTRPCNGMLSMMKWFSMQYNADTPPGPSSGAVPLACPADKGWPSIRINHKLTWPGCIDYERTCTLDSNNRPQWSPVQHDCSAPHIKATESGTRSGFRRRTYYPEGTQAAPLTQLWDNHVHTLVIARGVWQSWDRANYRGTPLYSFGPGIFWRNQSTRTTVSENLNLNPDPHQSTHTTVSANLTPDPRSLGSCFSTPQGVKCETANASQFMLIDKIGSVSFVADTPPPSASAAVPFNPYATSP